MDRRIEATWGKSERDVLESVGQLDSLLDRVGADARRSGRPQDVQLTASDAGTLGVVIGAERTVLNHVPADGNPPYLTSLGEEDVDRPFTYYVAGDHHTECGWRQTIPAEAGLEAARTFLLTGRLDGRIRWVEV